MIREIIKKPIVGLMKAMDFYSLFLLRSGGMLKEDGWFRSFREGRAVDLNGNPIPWLTYPAIEFIEQRICPDMCVFEYGCGASTLWWAARVKEVIACEHDMAWYREVVSSIPVNANIHHIPLEYGGEYSRLVTSINKKFDVIVIDGRDRVNCAINALNSLAPDGVIIWDNSDREEYREGYQHLFANGFKKIEFIGLAPIETIKTETGIFYRPGNCFCI